MTPQKKLFESSLFGKPHPANGKLGNELHGMLSFSGSGLRSSVKSPLSILSASVGAADDNFMLQFIFHTHQL